MSYNVIKNTGGQYTNESADGSIYSYMNPNGIYVVADALTSPITTQYIGSKISKSVGNLAVELGASTVATFTSTGITATTFTGDLSGNASTATTATNATITDTNTTGTYYPTFVSGTSTQGLKIDSATGPLTYDIASGVGTLTVRDKFLVTESASGTTNSVTYETDGSGNIQIISNTSNSNVNIGTTTKTGQNSNCIAIGSNSGTANQGQQSVAIGQNAGTTSQGLQSVAIGYLAGNSSQGNFNVSIGLEAGRYSAGQNAVAIGTYAGRTSLGSNGIVIGTNAGQSNCGNSTIIINSSGTDTSTTNNNNLILNAGSTAITSGGSSRFYINPVRNSYNSYLMEYDATNKEVTYYTNPLDSAGNLSGTATNATNVATTTDTTSTTLYPTFVTSSAGGNLPEKVNSSITYNATNGTLTTTTFSGALNGNASTATTATNATNTTITASSTNSTFYPSFVSATTGNLPQLVDSDLTYNPSTNTLSATNINATTFTGSLTGNASTATDATNSSNVGVSLASTGTYYPTFVLGSSGNQAEKVSSNLTFNATTNTLTTTIFQGSLLGSATNAEITDTNTAGTYYPTFVSGNGTQGLKIDSSAGPFSYAIDAGGVGTLTVRDKIVLTESALGTANSITYETDASGNIQMISNNTTGNVNIGTGTKTGQNINCIAIGNEAGNQNQSQYCVAIGTNAGGVSQSYASIGIGVNTCRNPSGANAICLGANAGQSGVGANTTIINSSGVNQSATNARNLILNASSSAVSSGGTDRCYITPIRSAYNSYSLDYDNTNKEVTAYSKLSTITTTTSSQNFLLSSTTNLVIKLTNIDASGVTCQLPSTAVDGQRISIKLIYDSSAGIGKPTVAVTTINTSHTIRGTNSVTLTKPYAFSTSSDYIEFMYYNGTFNILTLV